MNRTVRIRNHNDEPECLVIELWSDGKMEVDHVIFIHQLTHDETQNVIHGWLREER